MARNLRLVGLLCGSLGIMGWVAFNFSTTIAKHKNQIDGLNTTIASGRSPIDADRSQIDALNATIDALKAQVKTLYEQRDILFLAAYQREEITLGPEDSVSAVDRGNFSVMDTVDRTAIDCNKAIFHRNAAILLTLGQSNIANTIDGRFDPGPNVINFNPSDGKCYLAHDPLLGSTNFGGNVTTRLASKLVNSGAYQVVIVIPIAVDGTKVEDWAVGGFLNRRIVVAIKRLHDAGLEPTHVLWHQGESNVTTPVQVYRAAFFSVFSTIRRNGVFAPIYVAQTSICGGGPSEPIRTIQRGLVDPSKNILAGPDTDQLGPEFRYDTCHFNAAGGDRHAELWRQVLDAQESSDQQAEVAVKESGTRYTQAR
jgi:hypothetical protein